MSKILVGLVAFGANAKFATSVGAGVSGSWLKPRMHVGEKVFGDKPASIAKETGKWKFDGNKVELKEADGIWPVAPFADVRAHYSSGSVSFGAGLKAGYQFNLNRPDGDWYGNADEVTDNNGVKLAPAGFAVKYPSGAFFLIPSVGVGFDVMDLHICLSVGLHASYNTFEMKYGSKLVAGAKTAKAENWLFGVRLGVDAIYNVASCFGVGAGVAFTYWPEGMNKINQKNKAKEMNPSITDEKAELLNFGKSYSITASLSGHFALG